MPIDSQASSMIATRKKNHHNIKCQKCFSSNNSDDYQHVLFRKSNNYYRSITNRSIINCEKFLLDQDLIDSTQENDLLLVHTRLSPPSM